MGYSSEDAAADAAAADEGDRVLLHAIDTAETLAADFVDAWTSDPLSPDVTVGLEIGAGDQPVFVFTLLVDLDDDLPAEEFPEARVERLQSDLRSRIASTEVDDWDWIVTLRAKVRAQPR